MPDDILHRLILPKLNLRAYAAVTTATARDICRVHNTTPNAAAGLGKAISAAVLLSSSLKPGSLQSLSYKIQGSGPLKEVHVQVDAYGNVRGYTAHPRIDEETDLGSISFPRAIGAGLLTVTKDLGYGEPFSGVSHLVKGEIALDTAYYLTVSEQIPSALVLGLTFADDGLPAVSGGIMFQTFPDTPTDSVSIIEKNIETAAVSLGEHLLKGGDILTYLSDIADNAEIDILGSIPIRHRCSCDRQLILSILKTLDMKDLEEMIHKDGGAHVTCTFCNSEHHFSKEELGAVIQSIKG
ncbi:MAG: Hsp33 family molecular chaperone HslO [Spirochaetota bacterium]